MKKIILILLITLFIVTNSSAEEKRISIFFANGMFTFESEAIDCLNKIKTELELNISDEIDIRYALSKNSNEGKFTQVAQVAEQEGFLDRILENPSLLKNVLYSVLMGQIQKNEISIDGSTYVVDEDLERHLEQYQNELNAGRIVIVVAHSQGNFYANRAYYILQNENFHIVSVGNPDNYVGGYGRYVTLTNDMVINIIRSKIDPYTLNGNEINSESYEDTNHSFIESYMAGDESGPYIIQRIKELIMDTPPLDEIDLTMATMGNGEVTYGWENPTYSDFSHVEFWYSIYDSYVMPTYTKFTGTIDNSGTTISGLTNDIEYEVMIRTVNNFGNKSVGVYTFPTPYFGIY